MIPDMRFFCLCAAAVVYAVAGSPTPDAPGYVEGVIAFLLMAAAGVPGFYAVVRRGAAEPLWLGAGRGLLVYGLSFPLIAGAMRGAEAAHILRDVFPFMFMMLPLFTYDIFSRRPEYLKYFSGLIVCSGLVFAWRSLPESLGSWRGGGYEGELHYFSNAPSVLFAAVFLCAVSAENFARRFSFKAAIIFVVCCVVALLPLSVMVMTMQRASIGMFALSMAALALCGVYRYPQKLALMILIVAGTLGFFAWEALAGIFEMLGRKTALVGFNMRAEEMAAAWRQISAEPGSLLFGAGWGGTFESPAVGGLRVNYTHSLFSAMLLKTGLFGLALAFTYIVGVGVAFARAGFGRAALVLAIGAPFLIDVVFYAAYKSLDFGFILLLAVAAGMVSGRKENAQNVASGGGVLYSGL